MATEFGMLSYSADSEHELRTVVSYLKDVRLSGM
jgi:hypothetical protein